MIELPRAAITANKIAEAADFFSFGTNDLTQTTFGLSRDDAGKFLPRLYRAGYPAEGPVRVARHRGRRRDDPDRRRQGARDQAAFENGYLRRARRRPGLDHVLRGVGLDYVSCSPYRVPVARLAAAQAALGVAADRTA